MQDRYDVIVIGGGHAGVEAAWAAANLLPRAQARGSEHPHAPSEPRASARDATVAFITIDPSKIGVMSCNPANGGLAKGQLVREIDAMGGVMGLATDATGIQFRMLNMSKGPAVHGPRAQCDKHAYAECVQGMIASRPEIDVIAGTVEKIVVEGGRCRGVVVATKQQTSEQHATSSSSSVALSASAVVLTTGTFMRAIMHVGDHTSEGGRYGESAAVGISAALRELGFELGRLKTGTPPRLKRDTIDWQSLVEQRGDDAPVPFSDLTYAGIRHSAFAIREESSPNAESRTPNAVPSLHRFPVLPQVSCYQTSTTAAVHDVIRANLHRAPMFSGQIEGVGPRYCPSIEDKVVRFAERDTHGVFLEPESLRDDWIYCNGISTSLPADVQDSLVRSMPGCERAEILRYGYAVEYDMVRPHQIQATGETKLIEGLFLAGQINGTSGYEEAAAQGLVAGINAARRARGESEFVFGRDQAYIGVLMDDLVTKTPVEPYRMFTSRAEHRLLLRADNSADRLTPLADSLGLLAHTELGRLRKAALVQRLAEMDSLNRVIDATKIEGVPLEKLMRGQAFELADLRRLLPDDRTSDSAARTVLAERRYAAYIVRQHVEVRRQAEQEHRRLPADIDYLALPHLRTEARHSLAKFRPRTFGQAARLEGITPADITLLTVLLRKA